MEKITVVGSGASGVHFSLSLLRKGYQVQLLDVGNTPDAIVNPGDDFNSLKESLPDPVAYFLGEKCESLILPGNNKEYYGLPPSKSFVFDQPTEFRYTSEGFSPLSSFAAGGLAEAWTGGCYPFNDHDLEGFPFGFDVLRPYYEEVAERIGITGEDDDLSRFLPMHGGLLNPLDLDMHSATLLDAYRRSSNRLIRKFGCYMGRSRVAVLPVSRNGREACNYSGRCLWGCPRKSFYTPGLTLDECRRYDGFQYLPGYYVSHFKYTSGGRIRSLLVHNAATGLTDEIPVTRLALASGTLSTSRIFLESVHRDTGENLKLSGLMDNRQVLMPFVNLKLVGRRYNPNSYQYHQLAIGMNGGAPSDYVHGLITTLKTALVHPVIQSLPFDLGSSVSVFRNIRAALGLVNVNFSDDRRDDNYLTLEPGNSVGPSQLRIHYRPEAGERDRIRRAKRIFQKFLLRLGCVAPSAMSHVRPMGASVHYAGTLPMAGSGGPLTCTTDCRSRDFDNLFIVDGSTFPSLPSKNITFTLMANAVRIADTAF